MKRILIAIPCMDYVDQRFVQSLVNLNRDGSKYETAVTLHSGALIYANRDYLTMQALDTQADYVLWLDSDVVFEPDLLDKLIEDDKDIVSGLYFRRRPPFSPVIYKKIRYGDGTDRITEEYPDYPQDSLFEVDAFGMGACLVKTSVLKDIVEKWHTAFSPFMSYGEDISFCLRAKMLGYKLWCDSRIKLGHVAYNIVTETTWGAVKGREDATRNKDSASKR